MTFKVSVFGLGYVGTVFAACLAFRGFKVIGVDMDEDKVETVNKGKAPFYEPSLDNIINKAVSSGFLHATTDYIKAVRSTDISFIFVGTPSLPDGSTNLKYIKACAEMIGESLKAKNPWHLVVVRSTVPPGTTEGIVKCIIESISNRKCGVDFGLCMNPEFVKEGSAVKDTFHPSRVVIGEYNKRSGDTLESLYRDFFGEKTPPIIRTSIVNAELIKYAANAFLAMKISFINLIADVCEKLRDADVTVVAKGIGLDPRIGPYFLNAGIGFGGSCFPKDLRALINIGKKLGCNMKLLESVLELNEERPQRVIDHLKKLLNVLEGKRICVLGLAFKPNTDDIRESRAIELVKRLLKENASVVVFDPKAMNKTKEILGDKVTYASSAYECIRGSDAVIIATEWNEFKALKPEDYKRLMRTPIVIDGRRIYDPKEFKGKVIFSAIGLGEAIDRIENSK